MRNFLLTLIIFTLGMQSSECVGMRRVEPQCPEDKGRWAIPIPPKKKEQYGRNEFKDVKPNRENPSGYITGEAGSAQKKPETSPLSEVKDLNFDVEFN